MGEMRKPEELIKEIPDPPKDLVERLKKRGCFQTDWLVFRCGWMDGPNGKKVRCLNAVCSHCGAHFQAPRIDKPDKAEHLCHSWSTLPPEYRYRARLLENGMEQIIHQGDKVICPECGAWLTCHHINLISEDRCLEAKWAAILTSAGQDIIIAHYRVMKAFGNDLRSHIQIDKYEASILSPKKSYRFSGWTSGLFGSKTFTGKWTPKKRFMDYDGAVTYLFYAKRNPFRGTWAENCKLYLYRRAAKQMYFYPVSYLHLFRRYPSLENLLMQGFGKVVSGIISASCGNLKSIPGFINLKKVKPNEILGLSRSDFRCLKGKNAGIDKIRKFREARAAWPNWPPEELEKKVLEYGYRLTDLARYGNKAQKIDRYLHRQARKDPGKADINGLFSLWIDYHTMAIEIGINLDQEIVYYPPHLRAAHDRLVAEKKYREHEGLREKFVRMLEKTKPYTFRRGTYLIRPAESEEELIHEGGCLNHCVGGYGPTHCAGKPIFFIRKTSDPDTPYFTLQLDLKEKRIIQNHGRNNVAPPASVVTFQKFWLEHVVRADTGINRERIRAAG